MNSPLFESENKAALTFAASVYVGKDKIVRLSLNIPHTAHSSG